MDGIFVLGDALLHLLEVLHGPEVALLHLTAEVVEPQLPAVVDVPDQSSPRVDAVEPRRALEHRVGRARNHATQEAPQRRVEVQDLVDRHRPAQGVLELLGGDDVIVLALGPNEDVEEDRSARDEVPLDLILPLHAVLHAVELELFLERHLLIEDGTVLMSNSSEWTMELQRKARSGRRAILGRGYLASTRLRSSVCARMPSRPRVWREARRSCSGNSRPLERRHLVLQLGDVDAVTRLISSDHGSEDAQRISFSARAR